MSISSETNRVDYIGTGLVTTYSYTFHIFDETHLLVTKRTSAGVESTLVLNTDYTVTGVDDDTGGTVVLATALESGAALTIRRELPLTQPTDIRNQGSFFPETHEDAFDRGVMVAQQQQEEIDRSVKAPENDDALDDLPAASDRASKFLAFDADGQPIASAGGISPAVPVSAFMETVLDDASAAAARTTLGAATESEVFKKDGSVAMTANFYVSAWDSGSALGLGQQVALTMNANNDFALPDNFCGFVVVKTLNSTNNAHAFELGFVNLSGTDGVYSQIKTGGSGSPPSITSVSFPSLNQTLRIVIGAGSAPASALVIFVKLCGA